MEVCVRERECYLDNNEDNRVVVDDNNDNLFRQLALESTPSSAQGDMKAPCPIGQKSYESVALTDVTKITTVLLVSALVSINYAITQSNQIYSKCRLQKPHRQINAKKRYGSA